jgi:hypothetical protein
LGVWVQNTNEPVTAKIPRLCLGGQAHLADLPRTSHLDIKQTSAKAIAVDSRGITRPGLRWIFEPKFIPLSGRDVFGTHVPFRHLLIHWRSCVVRGVTDSPRRRHGAHRPVDDGWTRERPPTSSRPNRRVYQQVQGFDIHLLSPTCIIIACLDVCIYITRPPWNGNFRNGPQDRSVPLQDTPLTRFPTLTS